MSSHPTQGTSFSCPSIAPPRGSPSRLRNGETVGMTSSQTLASQQQITGAHDYLNLKGKYLPYQFDKLYAKCCII